MEQQNDIPLQEDSVSVIQEYMRNRSMSIQETIIQIAKGNELEINQLIDKVQ